MAENKVNFNVLGISKISDEIPNELAGKVQEKMDELTKKYLDLANEELSAFLEENDLESFVGVVFLKSQVKHF